VFVSDGPGTLLFRTPLRGDVSVAATVSRKGGAAVVLAAGSEQGAYRLALDRNGANVALHRGNKRIALPIAIAGEAGKVTLELTKRGPEILASVDSKPVLKFTDLHPLAAGRAGLAASGRSAFFDLTLRAESAAFYPFKTASPRWRESGGEWIIRAGIPDPTLGHWITGIARKRTGYLWERIERRGDFAWHVTVAPATEGYIDGGSVTFPLENVRLSFCSRLGQPESGYCVVIRPNGRDSIALLSANEPAVENEFLPPKGKPVRVSITRRQSKIEIRIDQSKVIEFDDPDPPAAGHLGLGVKNSRANFLDVLIMPIN
jgi:hypothetical protein